MSKLEELRKTAQALMESKLPKARAEEATKGATWAIDSARKTAKDVKSYIDRVLDILSSAESGLDPNARGLTDRALREIESLKQQLDDAPNRSGKK